MLWFRFNCLISISANTNLKISWIRYFWSIILHFVVIRTTVIRVSMNDHSSKRQMYLCSKFVYFSKDELSIKCTLACIFMEGFIIALNWVGQQRLNSFLATWNWLRNWDIFFVNKFRLHNRSRFWTVYLNTPSRYPLLAVVEILLDKF